LEDNYYLLLGLEPSVEDWSQIEAALQRQRNVWSLKKIQGAPAERNRAERWLLLLPQIEAALRDPEQRRRIAREAAQQLEHQRKQQLARLDELIGLLSPPSVKSNVVDLLQENVWTRASPVGPRVSKEEIVARLRERGIAVETPALDVGTGPPRPQLDPTRARAIRDHLTHLGLQNLYAFLGESPKSSPKALRDAADKRYRELQRQEDRGPDQKARLELAGHCMAVFQDEASRTSYDNTLAVEAMLKLEGHLRVAGHRGHLELQAVDRLIREAGRLGVSQELAREYIREFAGKNGWTVRRRARVFRAKALAGALGVGLMLGFLGGRMQGAGADRRLPASPAVTPGEPEDRREIPQVSVPPPMLTPARESPREKHRLGVELALRSVSEMLARRELDRARKEWAQMPEAMRLYREAGGDESPYQKDRADLELRIQQLLLERMQHQVDKAEGVARGLVLKGRYIEAADALSAVRRQVGAEAALAADDRLRLDKVLEDALARLKRACEGEALVHRMRNESVRRCPP